MTTLIGTRGDRKNIGILKTLYDLRQDLDILCLISANWQRISELGPGTTFFHHTRKLAIKSITLNICKTYETERGYELNSVDGVLKYLRKLALKENSNRINQFVQKYGDSSLKCEATLDRLASIVSAFAKLYESELERFKTFRDKHIAHNEYEFEISDLPSFEIMERLYQFASDFYQAVSQDIINVGPCDLNTERRVKFGLKRILEEHGVSPVITKIP